MTSYYIFNYERCTGTRVRVRREKEHKKEAYPARVAEVGQENIETVHEPKLIQAVDTLCMDRVAVLWKVPTARTSGYLKRHAPSR
jgi:hypothetical protein